MFVHFFANICDLVIAIAVTKYVKVGIEPQSANGTTQTNYNNYNETANITPVAQIDHNVANNSKKLAIAEHNQRTHNADSGARNGLHYLNRSALGFADAIGNRNDCKYSDLMSHV